jgi:endonuclease/exonuclease/phosphatase family metal-dependent hydrolase
MILPTLSNRVSPVRRGRTLFASLMLLSLVFAPALLALIPAATFCGVPPSPTAPDAAGSAAADSICIMTYNIRYDNPDDGAFAWTKRRDAFVQFVRSMTPDVFCIQEGLHRQVEFLQKGLPGFSFRGVGRDDGKTEGEYSAIYYRESRFRCLSDSTFWLSPTPDLPSKGWDAALPRIVTWVKLQDLTSGKRFFVFNTHFDHQGVTAREESAFLIRRKINQIAGSTPVLLTGDFNVDESENPHAVLIADGADGAGLIDTYSTSLTKHEGPKGTWAGFDGLVAEGTNRIDWIMASKGVTTFRHATLVAPFGSGYLSDHRPVRAELSLP